MLYACMVPMYDGVMAARKVGRFLRGLNLGTHVGWRAGAGECLMLIVIKNTPVLADFLINYATGLLKQGAVDAKRCHRLNKEFIDIPKDINSNNLHPITRPTSSEGLAIKIMSCRMWRLNYEIRTSHGWI